MHTGLHSAILSTFVILTTTMYFDQDAGYDVMKQKVSQQICAPLAGKELLTFTAAVLRTTNYLLIPQTQIYYVARGADICMYAY